MSENKDRLEHGRKNPRIPVYRAMDGEFGDRPGSKDSEAGNQAQGRIDVFPESSIVLARVKYFIIC